MKTSELIKALQAIDKTVPFDADVVTYGDIYPRTLVRVEHDPPHTYLVFTGDDSISDENVELMASMLSDEELNRAMAYRLASDEVRDLIDQILENGGYAKLGV